jgi:dihydroorotate dehydrogenase electron transfer subunit
MIRTAANRFTAKVTANSQICRDHYRLVLDVPNLGPTNPGQFIQIAGFDVSKLDAEPPEVLWSPGTAVQIHDPELTEPLAFLRRPFSLAGRNGDQIDIIHRQVGLATRYLASLNAGDCLDILGPLGNAFTLPTPGQLAILVGGGVGIPPMIYLASQLANRPAIAFAGALCRDLMPLTVGWRPYEVAEFAAHNVPAILCTDDGSLGLGGLVTQALEDFLDNRLTPEIPRADLQPVIYTCGPEPMMKRVADIALQRHIPCQIAVERAMACGMGTCQSCCIRVRKPDPAKPPLPGKDWCYRLACTDGPIFTAEQLLW